MDGKRRDRYGRTLPIAAAAALLLSFALVGCAGEREEEPAYVERPVEEIYDEAYSLLRRNQFIQAGQAFDEVERQHPYSIWARRAMLMSGFAYYQANKYEESIQAAERFIAFHPGNRDAPYAYYLKAICHYEQIQDVGRDQSTTLNALSALQEVVRRYPNSEYARDARLKIDLTRDHLAGKEMEIGRYYLKRQQEVAAINRFRNVIETYQTTSHTQEALHRLVESYLSLGLDKEAQIAAAVLGYNFPGSEWYRDSFRLLQTKDLQPKEDSESWIAQALGRNL